MHCRRMLTILAAGSLALTGCVSNDNMEQTEDAVEEVVDETGDAIDEAADELEDVVDGLN